MNTIISLILIIGGIILIGYGVNASESIGLAFSRIFTGAPTDKTIWLMIGGIIASIAGVLRLLRGSRMN